jgi:hypothetical protein
VKRGLDWGTGLLNVRGAVCDGKGGRGLPGPGHAHIVVATFLSKKNSHFGAKSRKQRIENFLAC